MSDHSTDEGSSLPSHPSPRLDLSVADKSFLDWLNAHGVTSPKIDWPKTHPTKGYRCALATADIESDESICEIPFDLMLCAPNCLRSPADDLGKLLRHMWLHELLKGDNLLCVCICREVILKERSSFAPYINFLLAGEEPGTISSWSESQQSALQDPGGLTVRIETRRRDELRMHATVVRQLGEESVRESSVPLSLDVPSLTSQLESLTPQLFVWSWHILQARAFGRRLPWSSLVPLADCLNHANLTVRYALSSLPGGGRVGAVTGGTTDPKDGAFRLFPSGGNRYKKGEEVFNSYGRRPNDHLMLDYGFSLLDNEWERVDLRLVVPPPDPSKNTSDETRIFGIRRRLLLLNGLNTVRTLKLRRGHLTFEAIVFFRIANMTEAELVGSLGEEDSTTAKVPVSRDDGGIPSSGTRGVDVVSLENERKSLAVLLAVLLSLQSDMSATSIELDEQLLLSLSSSSSSSSSSSPPLQTLCGELSEVDSDRLAAALAYRLTRKRIVAESVTTIEELLRVVDLGIMEGRSEEEAKRHDGKEAPTENSNNAGLKQWKRNWESFQRKQRVFGGPSGGGGVPNIDNLQIK